MKNSQNTKKPSKPMKPILIIDGYHLLYKGFYGSLKRKKIATNREGVIINAIYTFVGKIYNLIDSNRYHTIIIAFDADQGSWRKELYAKYKEKRKKTPEELIPQMQIIREFLTSANIPWYEKPGYEGDDIIGTIARKANRMGMNVEILSNDKDTFQLVNPQTRVITCASKKEKPLIITEKEVMARFGCLPSQVADIKALMGDQSDNIKGIRSFHHNTAIDLLKKYRSVEDMFANIDKIAPKTASKLLANKEHIFLNKKLAVIQCDMEMGWIDFRRLNVNWYRYLAFLKKHKMWAYAENVNKKIALVKAAAAARSKAIPSASHPQAAEPSTSRVVRRYSPSPNRTQSTINK